MITDANKNFSSQLYRFEARLNHRTTRMFYEIGLIAVLGIAVTAIIAAIV